MTTTQVGSKTKKDRRKFVRIALNEREKKEFYEIKEFLGLNTDSEVLRFLIKREHRRIKQSIKTTSNFPVRNNESRDQNNPPSSDKKPAEVKYCKTCGAPLPSPELDYCPDLFSCGNHLHVLGKAHDEKFCAFCKFPQEVAFAVVKKKLGWDWDKIRQHLETINTSAEISGIIQAARLELGEEE